MGETGLRKYLRIKNPLVREMLAEFVGTFILVSFSVGSGAQYVLSNHQLGNYLTVNAGSGVGLTLAIYWAGGVSGGYLNPCVTMAFCLRGDTPWWKLPFYSVAELMGAFLAAAVQFGVYFDALHHYDGGVRSTDGLTATAGIFSTFPNPNVSTLNCFFDQVFGTFILIGCILAITDKNGWLPHKALLPLALGPILFGIGNCWALNCGYAINPARDFGPRLFTIMAGWGLEPLSFRNYNWFWVPLAGPVTGTLLAWMTYMLFIELHWEQDALDDVIGFMTNKPEKEIILLEKCGIENKAFIKSQGQMFNLYVQSQAVIADASHGRSLWFYPSTASVTGGGESRGECTVTLTETNTSKDTTCTKF